MIFCEDQTAKLSGVMADQVTTAVCAFAAITSLIIVCSRTSGLESSDLAVLVFVAAPYLLLGLMAASVRERSTEARFLLIATVLVSLGGTALLGLTASPQPTRPEPGLAQSVTMILVPFFQLAAATVIGLVLLLRRLMG